MRTRGLLVMAGLLLCSVVSAGPPLVTYQGSVLQSGGAPLPNGTYRMRFTLYDAVSGGAARWTETDTAVAVYGGLFSTLLGDGSPLVEIFSNYPNLWLEVAIDANKDSTFAASEVYSPRQRVAAAAYAMEADTLDGQHASAFSTTVHNHDHGALTGLANDTHPQYFNLGQNETVAGRPAFNGGASGATPPFFVDSDFLVSLLNADRLDGQHAATFAPAAHNHWGADWSGTGNGMTLRSTSSNGIGIAGFAASTGTATTGVYGASSSRDGYGVRGYVGSTTGTTFGVSGYNDSQGGFGVHGVANNDTGPNVGVYGRADGNGLYGNLKSWAVAAHHFWSGCGLGVWSYNGDLIQAYDGDYPWGVLKFRVDNSGNVYAAGATTSTAYRFNTPKTYQASYHPREFVSQVDNPPDSVTRDGWAAYISSGAAPLEATIGCGVHLPQGARITELHAWVRDDDAAGALSISLNRLSVVAGVSISFGMASFSTTVESTDNQHLSTTSAAGWSVVDNDTYSYQITVVLSPSATGSNIAVRRVWIIYTLPEVSY